MSEIKNAIIKSARLDIGDCGFLQGWIDLDYGGSCQGFGGLVLYLPASFKHHNVKSPAGHWLFRVMEIAGADEWSRLVGKTVRARIEGGLVVAIGHIVKDDWFCPKDDFGGEE